jgi:hypothetical protein
MDYCYGTYTPGPVPNATLSKSNIHQNVTNCSNQTAMFAFDPTMALQRSLNESGVHITLADLKWPKDLENGIKALGVAMKASFVLYCIGIALCFLTAVASAFWVSRCSDGGRLTATLEILMAVLAFLSLGIASAITTAVAVKGNSIIDKYGKPIGVSADRGNGFLGLTWAATVLMFIASIVGCAGCFRKRDRKSVKRYHGEKP